jgi:hypothetical protein
MRLRRSFSKRVIPVFHCPTTFISKHNIPSGDGICYCPLHLPNVADMNVPISAGRWIQKVLSRAMVKLTMMGVPHGAIPWDIDFSNFQSLNKYLVSLRSYAVFSASFMQPHGLLLICCARFLLYDSDHVPGVAWHHRTLDPWARSLKMISSQASQRCHAVAPSMGPN